MDSPQPSTAIRHVKRALDILRNTPLVGLTNAQASEILNLVMTADSVVSMLEPCCTDADCSTGAGDCHELEGFADAAN